MVAPVKDHHVPGSQWTTGHTDWMPLPGLTLDGFTRPAALLLTLSTVSTDRLLAADRRAVMSPLGLRMFQQRLVHHLTRVVIEPAVLVEHCASAFAEAEVHEKLIDRLGCDAESDFHAFLDADDRKLRTWLGQPSTRTQAISSVRTELRRRWLATE